MERTFQETEAFFLINTYLQKSHYTEDLYKQYRKHLGGFRYRLLLESQKLVVPVIVKKMLHFKDIQWLRSFVPVYKFSRTLKLDGLIKGVILPAKYMAEIKALDIKG
ncbi:MAG: hypothetical protein ABIR78_14155 [Ferruginibacter sp.]